MALFFIGIAVIRREIDPLEDLAFEHQPDSRTRL
jgi:hypothetical protein